MKTELRPALVMLILLTIITGIVYPVLVTLAGQAFFKHEAEGSLIVSDGHLLGSSLIGQTYTDPSHFFGRPSATSPQPSNGLGSGGSNLGPTNPALVDAVKGRLGALGSEQGNGKGVPIELVSASASGLDPEITVAAALYQVPRVAKARNIDPAHLQELIEKHTKGPQLGFLGPARVNVLELNLDLDHK
jgi:K+-transporting ATPase ATPase C chain